MRFTRRRHAAITLAIVLAIGAALGSGTPAALGAETTPDVGEAPPTATTTSGTLEWGIAEQLAGAAQSTAEAPGRTSLLGGIEQQGDGKLVWSGGVGSLAPNGTQGVLEFSGGSGVRLQARPVEDEVERFSLDVTLTDPQVILTGNGLAELRVDVLDRSVADADDPGSGRTLDNLAIAFLELPSAAVADNAITFESAQATLTEEGSRALGSLLQAGQALAPVTFGASELPTQSDPVGTETELIASSASTVHGGELKLTATVRPAEVGGLIQFLDGGELIGETVLARDGTAVLETSSLAVGKRSLSARFVPNDPTTSAASVSSAVSVEVRAPGPAAGRAERASLTWGVKASFRNYIYNFTAFEGRTTMLGDASQPRAKGEYVWGGGTGTVAGDGSAADLKFREKDGVHFESHPMLVGGRQVWALDLKFTNPRIEIVSSTEGVLYFDVRGREFKSMTEAGDEFRRSGVRMAELKLPAFTAVQGGSGEKSMTWRDAQATLTAEGAAAFGGFYSAGETLDPVTFTLNTELEVESKLPTVTKVRAMPDSVDVGAKVRVEAAVTPALTGQFRFSYGGVPLGEPVRGKSGTAELETADLPVGIHTLTVEFLPEDERYGTSFGSTRVTVKSPAPPPQTPSVDTGTAAGSLQWGVSAQFVAYTTCEGKERFGMSHCAKGSILTEGVGAGYLFPQASGTNWNRATQTGTVQYSGSVQFKGYGETMFNVTNPSITVTDSGSATLNTGNTTKYGAPNYSLDLTAARKSVAGDGAVTWSGVPVTGVLSSGGAGGSGNRTIGFDTLTFTVGSESAVRFGSTAAGAEARAKRTPAPTPPATTGITVLTPADRIVEGGRIELEAPAFERSDAGVLVVLYSDPTVLDEEASADANGMVRWSGTLPKGITGTHTITFQGSRNVGAVIEIKDGAAKKSPAAAAARSAESGGIGAEGALRAGPAAAGAFGDREWWVSAAGLVAIASCMGLLAVRQRRLAEQDLGAE